VVETALFIGCQGTELPAILTRPAGPCRAAVILLHPADDPSLRQFLFEHLARVLPELGVAVLRYDRRTIGADRDVPYLLQVDDLNRGRDVLARELGSVPAGVWGFSQGAWVALLAAAADPALAFLMLVGCSAVSPARQMRYGTAEQLRRAGFGPQAIAELPGTTHHPTLNGGREISAISPEYTARLTRWLNAVPDGSTLQMAQRCNCHRSYWSRMMSPLADLGTDEAIGGSACMTVHDCLEPRISASSH
jgi:pimeloyl-ACP methyl ester carboxylesterase